MSKHVFTQHWKYPYVKTTWIHYISIHTLNKLYKSSSAHFWKKATRPRHKPARQQLQLWRSNMHSWTRRVDLHDFGTRNCWWFSCDPEGDLFHTFSWEVLELLVICWETYRDLAFFNGLDEWRCQFLSGDKIMDVQGYIPAIHSFARGYLTLVSIRVPNLQAFSSRAILETNCKSIGPGRVKIVMLSHPVAVTNWDDITFIGARGIPNLN